MTKEEINQSKYFDPFTRMIGLEVEELQPDGLTAKARLKREFCNTYSSAHGGFVYSVGHAAALLSAGLCLDRRAVSVDVSNEYECSLTGPYARIRTKLVSAGELMVFRVRVTDSKGKLCLTQIVTMKDADLPVCSPAEFPVTIIHGDDNSPVDPVTGIYYPRLSVFFSAVCHTHVLGRGEKGMIYGADLFPETVDAFGAAHPGMIYTVCDSAAGGSAAFLLEKKPVTVSSSIHYLRSITQGPVRAETKLVRAGKQLLFYTMDITDGNGALAAVAQFVMQCVDYEITNEMSAEYRRKAFK